MDESQLRTIEQIEQFLRASAEVTSKAGVASWSLKDKFETVLNRTEANLPGALRFAYQRVTVPLSRKILARTLSNWALSHCFGGTEALDCGMLLVSLGFPMWRRSKLRLT